MRKIVLHGPAIDRHGNFRDAGDVLTVGGEDNADTDLTTARADELLNTGIAVTLADEKEAEAVGEEVTKAELEQLDHDGDGQPGGSLPRGRKAKAAD